MLDIEKGMVLMKKILVIDDSEMVTSLISEFIEDFLGLVVEVANTSQEGKIFIDKEDYDLIICDFEMPGGNGHEVLEYLTDNKKMTDFVYFSGKYDLYVDIEPPLVHTFTDKNYEKLFSFLSKRYLE